jgi:ABC-type nitrate/sulfonate/bicarbonate transport system substrate-binding protein
VKKEPQTNQIVQIRFGYLASFTNTPLMDAEKNGNFKKRNVNIELVPFSSGSQIAEALAGGKIQIAVSIESSLAFSLRPDGSTARSTAWSSSRSLGAMASGR